MCNAIQCTLDCHIRENRLSGAFRQRDTGRGEKTSEKIYLAPRFIVGLKVSQDRQIVQADASHGLLIDCPGNFDTPTIVYNALQDECSKYFENTITNKFPAVAPQLVFGTRFC